MYRLSAEITISSAHYLNDYEGPCADMHGHNWRIVASIRSATLDEKGIVFDFNDLSKMLENITLRFDHKVLNNLEPFDQLNPTAENMACYLFLKMKKQLPDHIQMDKIQVWETEKYLVEYSPK